MSKEEKEQEEQEESTEEVEDQEGAEDQEEESTEEVEDQGDEEDTNENQVERLRQEKKDLQEENEQLKGDLSSRIDSLSEQINEKHRDELLDQYAGDDEDTRKALLQEFKNYRPGDTDKDSVEERMEKAARIVSSDTDNPSILDGATSSGGGINRDTEPKEEGGIPESTKKQGEVLGITEDDYEEYGDNIN